MRTRTGRRSAGFTLVELMITVAIVAILATVMVVAYSRHVRSGRTVEAHDILSRIQLRQEAYFEINRIFCNASGNNGFHPAIAGGFKPKTWGPAAPFGDLGLQVEKNAVYFSYLVQAGVPPGFNLDATATALGLQAGRPWYYALARADMDGDATNFTEYRVTSARSQVVIINQGK